MSPSQFDGSSEKLLVNEMDGSPQHFIRNPESRNPYGPGPFTTSSGRPSPCSSPTPPPFSRQMMSPPNSNRGPSMPSVSCKHHKKIWKKYRQKIWKKYL
jgi:hypothetical protein